MITDEPRTRVNACEKKASKTAGNPFVMTMMHDAMEMAINCNGRRGVWWVWGPGHEGEPVCVAPLDHHEWNDAAAPLASGFAWTWLV